MSSLRLQKMQKAALAVLDTLVVFDHIAIISFSASASQICSSFGGVPCGQLSRATAENVEYLKAQVDYITIPAVDSLSTSLLLILQYRSTLSRAAAGPRSKRASRSG